MDDPRHRERRWVDGAPASSTCDAGNRVPPFPTAAAFRSGDLLQCGPALIEKANLKSIEVHSRDHDPRSTTDPMKSKFLRVLLALAVTLTFSALAQTGSAATPSSPDGAAAAAPATTTT